MKKDLESVIAEAKRLNSYFVTVTTKDSSKEEGDLSHYTFQQEFPIDDIVPSIDASLRSLKIFPEQPIPVSNPPKIFEKRKPLKIAILTHFNRCPDSYSPGKAVKNQIKILKMYGHEVVFFVADGSTMDAGCEMRPVMPKFKRKKWVIDEEAKNRIIDVLRTNLTDDFDLAITHDFYIDDCITFREAIMECGVDIPWLHWARSGVGKSLNFSMDNARYVYMNKTDAGRFASRIGTTPDKIRIVFNEKDPSLMYNWHPITRMISDHMRLWEKDIIQIYPMCTTRMDAKGINQVINVFGELKRAGKNVALIICNSNGRKRLSEIEAKIKVAIQAGLDKHDFVFTSTLASEKYPTYSEVPHQVVAELMQVSNLFIFPTTAEVCSNVLLEASIAQNLLVLNKDLPSLFDFADSNAVLSYPFTSARSIHYSGRDKDSLSTLARNIIGQLMSNKNDRQFRKVWSTHNVHSIYRNQLEPILYEQVRKK